MIEEKYYKLLNDVVNGYNRCTPERILSLRQSQVFVFGTDLQGSQKLGAAGFAAKSFGAKVGVSNGPTGRAYALPTRGVSISQLKQYVADFEIYARNHTELQFLVTAVGCGHAGLGAEKVAPLFIGCVALCNVFLPKLFIMAYKRECHLWQKEHNKDNTDISQILENFSSEIHEVVKYLYEHNITFNHEGGYALMEGTKVCAEAELGIESEKIVFMPFSDSDKQRFIASGYKVMTGNDFIISHRS